MSRAHHASLLRLTRLSGPELQTACVQSTGKRRSWRPSLRLAKRPAAAASQKCSCRGGGPPPAKNAPPLAPASSSRRQFARACPALGRGRAARCVSGMTCRHNGLMPDSQEAAAQGAAAPSSSSLLLLPSAGARAGRPSPVAGQCAAQCLLGDMRVKDKRTAEWRRRDGVRRQGRARSYFCVVGRRSRPEDDASSYSTGAKGVRE